MRNRIINNQGLSLAEVMVTSVIFLMVVSGFYAALAAGDSSWQTNSTKIELQQNLRIAMGAMIYDLRQAGPASIADVPSDDTPYTQLTFRKPSGITNGSITWQANQIRFVRGGVSGNDLLRVTLPANTSQLVTENITNLQFTRSSTNPDELTVSMQATKNTLKGIPIAYDLDVTFQIRN